MMEDGEDAHQQVSRRSIAVLASVSVVGSLGIQMFVPAMPVAARALHASAFGIQLTVSVYLAGLAVGQLISGVLADALGRRTVLLAGTMVFFLASLLCAAAPSLSILLAGRIFQALGAAAGLVTVRIILAESGRSGVRHMSTLMALTMLSPLIAPLLGSAVANSFGWRAIFSVLAAASLFALGAGALWLRESGHNRQHPSVVPIMAGYTSTLQNGQFVRAAVIAICCSGNLYSFLALAPFLLIEPGAISMPLTLSLVAAGGAVGAIISFMLARRTSATAIARLGTGISVAAAIGAFAGSLLIGGAEIPSTMMILLAMGAGILLPGTLARAAASNPSRRGLATSLYGVLQMSGGAIISLFVALLPHSWTTLSAVLLTLTVVIWIASPRRSAGHES